MKLAIAAACASAVVVSAFTGPAHAAGPVIQWDYSMSDNFGPMVSGTVGPPGNQQDLTGKFVPQNPMTADPSYPEAGNALYGTVPADGKYAVTLDACATKVSGSATYAWTIDGDFTSTSQCRTVMKLGEGTRNYSLKVTDDTGATQVTGTFVVKDVLVVIMGDSYASGEGYPPFVKNNVNPKDGQPYTVDSNAIPTPKYIPDWDETSCQRTRWSGFVRAAAQLEKLDTHSSVTLIDVACAGAQVSGNDDIYKTSMGGGFGGLLTPKQPLNAVGNWPDGASTPLSIPPQIDQINALRKGQQIDVNLLSIGGNDLGFGPIVTQCLELAGYDMSCFNGVPLPSASVLVNGNRPLWEGVDEASAALTDKYAKTAACLGSGNCQTLKPGSNIFTDSTPLGINGPDTIQAVYPNLVNDSTGAFCNRSVNSLILPNGQSREQWDISMRAPIKHSDADYLTNVAIAGQGGANFITLWKGNTNTVMDRFVPSETQNFVILTPQAPSFLQHMMTNAGTYHWTIAFDPYLKSAAGGMCADDATRVIYPVLTDKFGAVGINQSAANLPVVGDTLNRGGAVHPNDKGQQNYADSLFPKAKAQSGLPVVAKTQRAVTPTPDPVEPPSRITAKTKKSTCGKKFCHVVLNFTAPQSGPKPDGYKVKVKVKGGKWKQLDAHLHKTRFVWKKAPWRKHRFQAQIASYVTEDLADGGSTVFISWSKPTKLKIRR